MPQAGRLGDKSQCPSCSHSCPGCPHSVIGPSKVGSPNVRINGKSALRVGDSGVHSSCCGANKWEAVQGAPGVRINGKFAFRMGDAAHHCGGSGRLAEGSPNVNIGNTVAPGARGAGSPAAPTHVVWYQVLDEYMRPVRDLVTHLTSAAGGPEITRRTDANGQVRVPVSQTGDYHVSLGPEHPLAAPAQAHSAPATAPAASPPPTSAPAAGPPASAPAATPPPTATPIATRHRVATTQAQSLADSAPTRHDLAWSIKVVTPTPDQKLFIEAGQYDPLHDGTDAPTPPLMPTLDLCANVYFKHDGSTEELKDGTVIWEFRIKGKYRVRYHQPTHKDNPALQAQERERDRQRYTFPVKKGKKGKNGAPDEPDEVRMDMGYRLQPYDLPGGKFASAPGETVTVRLAPGKLVGGDLEVKAQFEASTTSAHAGVKIEDVFPCGEIRGKNPAAADLHNYILVQAARRQARHVSDGLNYGNLAWLFFRIFHHESGQHQFNPSGGAANLPNYGDPAGVGIGQRDRDSNQWNFPSTDPQQNLQFTDDVWPEVFWNWKINVISGMEELYEKLRNAKSRLHRIAAADFPKDPPVPTDNQVIREAIREYNGGSEFQMQGREFVISPHTSGKGNRYYPDWVLHEDQDPAQGDPHTLPAGSYPIPQGMPIEQSDLATIKAG